MATLLKNGKLSHIKPLDEAIKDFKMFSVFGMAESFHTGTKEELEKQEKELMQERIESLEKRLEALEESVKPSVIIKPSSKMVDHFSKPKRLDGKHRR